MSNRLNPDNDIKLGSIKLPDSEELRKTLLENLLGIYNKSLFKEDLPTVFSPYIPKDIEVDFARRKRFSISYTDSENSVDFILEKTPVKIKKIEALSEEEALDKFKSSSDYKTKIIEVRELGTVTDYNTINSYYKIEVAVPINHIIVNVTT